LETVVDLAATEMVADLSAAALAVDSAAADVDLVVVMTTLTHREISIRNPAKARAAQIDKAAQKEVKAVFSAETDLRGAASAEVVDSAARSVDLEATVALVKSAALAAVAAAHVVGSEVDLEVIEAKDLSTQRELSKSLAKKALLRITTRLLQSDHVARGGLTQEMVNSVAIRVETAVDAVRLATNALATVTQVVSAAADVANLSAAHAAASSAAPQSVAGR
jgi:hypothetical protein